MTMEAAEVAALVPCSLDYVGRLRDLGLLNPAESDGLYPSSDVHIVRLMAAFEAVGVSLEDVARGVAAGELTFPFGRFMPDPQPLSETFDELAARLGRPAEFLRRLSVEFGLAHAPDDRVRTEGAPMGGRAPALGCRDAIAKPRARVRKRYSTRDSSRLR